MTEYMSIKEVKELVEKKLQDEDKTKDWERRRGYTKRIPEDLHEMVFVTRLEEGQPNFEAVRRIANGFKQENREISLKDARPRAEEIQTLFLSPDRPKEEVSDALGIKGDQNVPE